MKCHTRPSLAKPWLVFLNCHKFRQKRQHSTGGGYDSWQRYSIPDGLRQHYDANFTQMLMKQVTAMQRNKCRASDTNLQRWMPQKVAAISPKTGKYCSGPQHCQFWELYQGTELWHLQKKTPSADGMWGNETSSTETCQTVHRRHHLKANTCRRVGNQDTQLDSSLWTNHHSMAAHLTHDSSGV